jgi:predicted CoA-binding protein
MSREALVDVGSIERFLDAERIVLVGASDDPKSFSTTVGRVLAEHGYEVVPVNRSHALVGGRVCYPDVSSVPAPVDHVMVMVPAEHAVDVVRDCIRVGVRHVWLFRGVGGVGATSHEATELCREAGVDVVDGACPLMFLEPVGWFHRLHRSIRRHRGALAAGAKG